MFPQTPWLATAEVRDGAQRPPQGHPSRLDDELEKRRCDSIRRERVGQDWLEHRAARLGNRGVSVRRSRLGTAACDRG